MIILWATEYSAVLGGWKPRLPPRPSHVRVHHLDDQQQVLARLARRLHGAKNVGMGNAVVIEAYVPRQATRGGERVLTSPIIVGDQQLSGESVLERSVTVPRRHKVTRCAGVPRTAPNTPLDTATRVHGVHAVPADHAVPLATDNLFSQRLSLHFHLFVSRMRAR